MLQLVLNRKELTQVIKLLPNGQFGFYSKKEAAEELGKCGYTFVLRPKLESGTKIKGLSVSNPLRTSGKGDTGTVRSYWICPHGRIPKMEGSSEKTPRFDASCCIVVSCLKSSFHPNQEQLVMEITPSKCMKCLLGTSTSNASAVKASSTLSTSNQSKGDNAPPIDVEAPSSSSVPSRTKLVQFSNVQVSDCASVKECLLTSFVDWQASLPPNQEVFLAIPALIESIGNSLNVLKPAINVFGTSKELKQMTLVKRSQFTTLVVPKRAVKVSSLMKNLPKSSTPLTTPKLSDSLTESSTDNPTLSTDVTAAESLPLFSPSKVGVSPMKSDSAAEKSPRPQRKRKVTGKYVK
jgi:hypothetical protein